MRRSTLRRGRAHRVGAHRAVGLRGYVQERLRLPVELLQVEADRAVEGEQVRADRLARGIGDADAREAERVLERRVEDEVAETVGEPRGEWDPLAVGDVFAPALRHGHEAAIEPFLQPACVFHADLHPRQQGLEHARRGEVIGRADLAQVARRRLGALRARHAEARDIALRIVEVVVADPGERQVGEHLVAIGQLVESHGRARRGDRALAAQHHALRPAGGARGVENRRRVRTSARVDAPVEFGGGRAVLERRAAFRHDGFERRESRARRSRRGRAARRRGCAGRAAAARGWRESCRPAPGPGRRRSTPRNDRAGLRVRRRPSA